MQIRLGTASALVNRLDRCGLAHRRENPRDRRQTLVELSAAGEAMLARVEADAIERTTRMVARMSDRGRQAWLIALDEAVLALAQEDETT